ncbi:hypothetical protein AB0D67_12375 [Streptosporangium sp. NPDC048047]|uniref:hypothetical protein n=1 Tax=Streptosporangium sp. NPDC048047 TaxID=3155748 RepID=UPI003429C680
MVAAESVFYLERPRRLNGLPLSLDLTYLVRDVGDPPFDANLERNVVFLLLERVAGQLLGPPGGGHHGGKGRPPALHDGVFAEMVCGVGVVADMFTDRSDSPAFGHGRVAR